MEEDKKLSLVVRIFIMTNHPPTQGHGEEDGKEVYDMDADVFDKYVTVQVLERGSRRLSSWRA